MNTFITDWLLLPQVTDALFIQSGITTTLTETSTCLESPAFVMIQSVDTVSKRETMLRISGIVDLNGVQQVFAGFFAWNNRERRGGKIHMIVL